MGRTAWLHECSPGMCLFCFLVGGGKLCHRIKWNSITSHSRSNTWHKLANQNAPCSGGQWLARSGHVTPMLADSWSFPGVLGAGAWKMVSSLFYLRTTQLKSPDPAMVPAQVESLLERPSAHIQRGGKVENKRENKWYHCILFPIRVSLIMPRATQPSF